MTAHAVAHSPARQRLLDALNDHGSQISTGGSAATCPAHDDRAPSLSISDRADRSGVLVKCHAGCQVEDVLRALGMSTIDLFDEPRGRAERPETVATYQYSDSNGDLLYEKVRLAPKAFRQRRPDGRGGWEWKLGDSPRVLYRLAEVLAAIAAGQPIALCEGEKDAESARAAGVTATTWTDGAWREGQTPKWRPEYTDALRGAHVRIVRDRDDAGRHTAATIAELLRPVAASVEVYEPVEGKDLTDHLTYGHTLDDLAPVAFNDPHEAETAPPAGDEDEQRDAEFEKQLQFNRQVSDRLEFLRIQKAAADRFAVELAANDPAPPFDAGTLAELLALPKPPPMRAEGIIPSDAGTLVVAQRKTGKTTLILNWAHSLITGREFLGRFPVRPIAGKVGILNYEVSREMLTRWAHEHGIPGDRLYIANLRGRRNPLGHPGDRESLAQLLREHSVESLIVDPFGRAFTGKNQNDPGEVGAWLAELDEFGRAEAGAVDIMLCAHAGWNGERSRGASSLEDWADVNMYMTRDANDDRRRFIRAEGRDVLVDEDELLYDETTRSLTMSGNGSRRQAKSAEKVAELAQFVRRAATQVPGASTTQITTIIRKMADGPGFGFQDRDVSKAAKWAQERGLLRIIDNGPGRPKNHYPDTPSNPVQTPSTDAPPTPRPPRLYRDGVGVDRVSSTDPDQSDGVTPCDECGQPLHWQRTAYGKTSCLDCDTTNAEEAS